MWFQKKYTAFLATSVSNFHLPNATYELSTQLNFHTYKLQTTTCHIISEQDIRLIAYVIGVLGDIFEDQKLEKTLSETKAVEC